MNAIIIYVKLFYLWNLLPDRCSQRRVRTAREPREHTWRPHPARRTFQDITGMIIILQKRPCIPGARQTFAQVLRRQAARPS